MARVVVLADDMTGAADTAVAFTNAGMRAGVFLHLPPEQDFDVVALDLRTRDTDEESAARAAAEGARAALAMSPAHLYKKVDSTLRGHIGAEVHATAHVLAEVTAKTVLSVVAVAYPQVGRIVRAGCVRVARAEGEASGTRHPEAPMCVATAIRKDGVRTEVIALHDVRRGVDHLAGLLLHCVAAGVRTVVVDAETPSDLRVVATASALVPRTKKDVDVLWVGSGGLARELPTALGLLPLVRPPTRRLPVRPGRIVAVVGSSAPISRAQHRALVAQPGVSAVAVRRNELGERGKEPADDHIHALDQALLRGDVSLWRPEPLEGVVIDPQECVANDLAAVVAASSNRISTLITTGGQTTAAVLRALALRGAEVIYELEPGVVACVAIGDPTLGLVTKGGGFGDAETLARCRTRIATAVPTSMGNRPDEA